MITKQTAYDIVMAYEEIAKGQKLLADLKEQMERGEVASLRDSFGRQRSLQLGVPTGESSQRLFDVAPSLAVAVIHAHVAQKGSELLVLNEKAKAEGLS